MYTMLALTKVFALAAITLGNIAQAHSSFDIGFQRFEDQDCTSEIGKHTGIEENDCFDWDDGEPFGGFIHQWDPNWWRVLAPWSVGKDDLAKYGSCSIHAWAEEDCSGEYLGALTDVGLSKFSLFTYC